MTRVIGLISGTSVDGIDAALVDISGTNLDLQVTLIAGATYPYPDALRSQILSVCSGQSISMAEMAELDDAIATQFAQAALSIQANQPQAELIGSHGQTVFHRPTNSGEKNSTLLAYSLQLGRGAAIAYLTSIPTVSNLRAADVAAGGEGAPLVSRIDACLLSHPTHSRCIQNIGGIGNLTYLPATQKQATLFEGIRGWDTGPGNTLLDLAVQHLSDGQQTYDQDGVWAAMGKPCETLVNQWLEHPYFRQSPPKSTGRELFGWDYFNQCLTDAEPYSLGSADLLATLTELTVVAIAHSYQTFLPEMPDQVLLCGGGSRNLYLKQRLKALLGKIPVLTTDDAGLSADFKEAIAFAVLAYWRKLGLPGNLPQVTGARRATPLGELHLVV
ncbi:MAG: anhydro-N-acetylmuramic acid kinase [Leptolyngbyaceae cyanobacterium RM1_405_57]|nr:anhydro-N-acetylmuramic acid kinase [Leptolyngbyaceae cyanobacterium RM1_405_57]